jgi:Reverse transcriptase (RNA-dependent DNA polymerase)
MEIPKGFEVHGDPGDYVLECKKNIYGHKEAGLVWNKHLVARLKQVGFTQCEADPCIFIQGEVIYLLYVDDSILLGPNPDELDTIIEEMKGTGSNVTVEGEISDFLGVKTEHKDDGTIHLTQPHLIDSILKELNLDRPDNNSKDTPAASSKILGRHPESKDFDNYFHYRRAIGKLNYLEKSTRPDIAYAVHQCASFSSDHKSEHGSALKWLGRYLHGTREQGIIMRPTGNSFDVYVDADFAGNWIPNEAMDAANTARSRYGYIVMSCYMGIKEK